VAVEGVVRRHSKTIHIQPEWDKPLRMSRHDDVLFDGWLSGGTIVTYWDAHFRFR